MVSVRPAALSPAQMQARRWRSICVAAVSLCVAVDANAASLRVLHLTDSHISLSSGLPPYSDRMAGAFAHTTRYGDGTATTALAEFELALERAKKERPDLIAIGGDMVNYPDNRTLVYALERLRETGLPFLFMNGNHDWHLERLFAWESRYDSQLVDGTWADMFEPLYSGSGVNLAERNFSDPRFGVAVVKGVAVVMMDNSNYQIDQDQLAFFSNIVASGRKIVLVVHIPLCLPGLESMPPKMVMGHPNWAPDADSNAQLEKRLPWPATGNLPSTLAFIKDVQRAAQSGSLLMVLSGHTHEFAEEVVPPAMPGALLLAVGPATSQVQPYDYLRWTSVPVASGADLEAGAAPRRVLGASREVMQITSGPGFAGYSSTYTFPASLEAMDGASALLV